MTQALIVMYFMGNSFLAGVWSEVIKEYALPLRLFALLCSVCFGLPILIIAMLEPAYHKVRIWLLDNTGITYFWEWHTGYYDKKTQEEIKLVIARAKGRMEWAAKHNRAGERKWKLFFNYANKLIAKYDPDNKIKPDLYA